MAKIRTIKPELFRHEELFEAEAQSKLPLRLCFIGLLTCCDREGRFKWTPRSLKLDVIPYDDSVDFAAVLDALQTAGFIKKYEVDNKQYGFIPSWHLHQVINKREPMSRLPSPYRSEFIFSEAQNMDWQVPSNHLGSYAMSSVGVHMADSQWGVPNASFNMPTTTEIKAVSVSLAYNEVNGSKSMPSESEADHVGPATSVIASHTSTNSISAPESIKHIPDGSSLIIAQNLVAQPISLKSIKKADITAVFNQWKQILNHPTAVLDAKRYQIIQQALALGYSVSQLSDAIRGCSQTPYYMGDNDRGQCYDGLHLIFKDADRIEQFIRYCAEPPCPPSKADRLSYSNQIAADRFVEKMKAEYAAVADNVA